MIEVDTAANLRPRSKVAPIRTRAATGVGGHWRNYNSDCYNAEAAAILTQLFPLCGQVAQLVERSPEKAGVGGSIPSLATIFFSSLQISRAVFRGSSTLNYLEPLWNQADATTRLLALYFPMRTSFDHATMFRIASSDTRTPQDQAITDVDTIDTDRAAFVSKC